MWPFGHILGVLSSFVDNHSPSPCILMIKQVFKERPQRGAVVYLYNAYILIYHVPIILEEYGHFCTYFAHPGVAVRPPVF